MRHNLLLAIFLSMILAMLFMAQPGLAQDQPVDPTDSWEVFKAVEGLKTNQEKIELLDKALVSEGLSNKRKGRLLFLRGRAHRLEGNLDQALKDLDASLELYTNQPEALHERGLIHYERKEYQPALIDIHRAISYDIIGHDKTYDLSLARVCFKKGEYKQAIDWYGAYLNAKPDDPVALHERGQARVREDDLFKALKDYKKSLDLHMDEYILHNYNGLILRVRGEPEKASLEFEEAIRMYSSFIEAYYNRGVMWLSEKQYDRALPDYVTITELDPNNSWSIYELGLVRFKIGDYKEAETDFTRALDLDPQNAIIYNARGNLYLETGEPDKALSDYNRAVVLKPRYAWAYRNRAIAWRDKGVYDKAIADLNKALGIIPKWLVAYRDRGLVWIMMGQMDKAIEDLGRAGAIQGDTDYEVFYWLGHGWFEKWDLEQAVENYTKAIKAKPDFANAYLYRGRCWVRAERYREAIDDFSKALDIEPDDTDAMLRRAWVWQRIGEFEKALADVERAIELDPKDPTAYIVRGYVYLGKGDLAGAIAEYDQALELDPDLAQAYVDRAYVRQKMGEFEKAVKDYDRAVALAPSDPNIYWYRSLAHEAAGNLPEAVADLQKVIEMAPGYPNAKPRLNDLLKKPKGS